MFFHKEMQPSFAIIQQLRIKGIRDDEKEKGENFLQAGIIMAVGVI